MRAQCTGLHAMRNSILSRIRRPAMAAALVMAQGLWAPALLAEAQGGNAPPVPAQPPAPAQPPPPLPAAVPPPPLPADRGDADTDEAPQVTVIHRDKQVVEEVRINGQLRYIRVTPPHGRPYYLIPDAAGGTFARRDSIDSTLMVPLRSEERRVGKECRS